MTDPIADMITRLRNAVHARHQRVDVPASRFKAEIARILEQEGYIQGFRLVDPASADGRPAVDAAPAPAPDGADARSRVIRIFLKYGPRGENVISGLQRVSRPGRRVYLGREDVPKVLGGLGTSILTTSRGVMTGKDAVRAGVGGEVLCNVW
jgi:small subunit ribosomal protein S8